MNLRLHDARASAAVPRQNDVGTPFVGSHSLQGIAGRAGLSLSGQSRVDGSRSPVDYGGKREQYGSWHADQGVGRAFTLLDGRIDGGDHRLREAAQPCRPPALRRASRGARPCRARDACVCGDSTRSTRLGCDACGVRSARGPARGTRGGWRRGGRSAKGFCQGQEGAVGTSRIRIPLTGCRNG